MSKNTYKGLIKEASGAALDREEHANLTHTLLKVFILRSQTQLFDFWWKPWGTAHGLKLIFDHPKNVERIYVSNR